MGTVTQTITEEQFLAADLDEMVTINEKAKKLGYKTEIVWRNVALFAALHAAALVGAYQLIFTAKWLTVIWTFSLWILGSLGITAGAHRLWSHRSYEAKMPVRIFLMLLQSLAFQNDVIEWTRDHRCHHKWTDTDADPHNMNRGFFFSHMGWLLTKKHPMIKEQGAKLDLSDLLSDPVLVFQRKYYPLLVLLCCFILPTFVAVWGWGETTFIALYTTALFRYCWTLHGTWFVNSAAHTFGYRPYDVNITPADSTWVTLAAVGEGGHNYHHTFPQDYRTSEYSMQYNVTKMLIDGFALLGLVTDRKVVKPETIRRQMGKHGDPHFADQHHLH